MELFFILGVLCGLMSIIFIADSGSKKKKANEKPKRPEYKVNHTSESLKRAEEIIEEGKKELESRNRKNEVISFEKTENVKGYTFSDFLEKTNKTVKEIYREQLEQPFYVAKKGEDNLFWFDEEVENIDFYLPNVWGATFEEFEANLIKYFENDEDGICVEIGIPTNVSYEFDPEIGLLRLFGTGPMPNYLHYEGTYAPWYLFREGIKKVIIEEGITTVGMGAFYDCRNLIEVELFNTVERICDGAFCWCENLDKINIPESVKVIDYGVFQDVKDKEKIVIPDTVEEKDGIFGEEDDEDDYEDD